MTFLEHSEKVCAPRARLGTRATCGAIRWAIRQLRFEGATIAGLARQLATTWNPVWSLLKPCLPAASDDPARFAGVRAPRVDERRVAPPRPTPPGPTRAHRHRGPLAGRIIPRPTRWTCSRAGLAPCTRTVGRARKRLARGGANRDAGSPSRDSKNAIALACSKDATSVLDACHIVTQAGDAPDEVRRRVQQDTTGNRGRKAIPSTKSGFSCAP